MSSQTVDLSDDFYFQKINQLETALKKRDEEIMSLKNENLVQAEQIKCFRKTFDDTLV